MSKKSWIVASIIILFLFVAACILIVKDYRQKEQIDVDGFLSLTLHGKQIIEVTVGEEYQEEGYDAKDTKEGDLTSSVEIDNRVNYQEPGTYEIIYRVENSDGEVAERVRYVTVNASEKMSYKREYDAIDNTSLGWWDGNKHNGERPLEGAGSTVEILKKYNAYYIGNDEKVLYLTFDEGSNDTYVKEIVEVLNQNDVKGTFFFCKNFIVSNPELMKSLAEHGHSVGNHTATHQNMPSLATEANFQKFVNQITANEEAFQSITGVAMDKVYREPKGEWSERSLQIVKDMGYKSYFWSADYLDWDQTVTKERALAEWLRSLHNGAIYLIHPKNKGNYEALDEFIKEMKHRGYRFDLVKNIS